MLAFFLLLGTTRDILRAGQRFLDHPILRVGHGVITVGSSLMAIGVMVLTVLISRLLKRARAYAPKSG